jgi:hypothetical protein
MIGDHDPVAPDIATVIRIGLLLQIVWLDADLYISCQGAIHAPDLLNASLTIAYSKRPGSGIQ